MKSGLSVTTKFDTNKNQVSVNPVNNINVNVTPNCKENSFEPRERTIDTTDLALRSTDTLPNDDVKVVYGDENPYSSITTEQLQREIEALKIIIDIMKSNPIYVNKLTSADDAKLGKLVQLLTGADEVSIDAEDLGSGCCTTNIYRKVHAIYVIKDGNTKNLKYDYPDVTKELKELGINTKVVW